MKIQDSCVAALAERYDFFKPSASISDKVIAMALWVTSVILPLIPGIAFFTCWCMDLRQGALLSSIRGVQMDGISLGKKEIYHDSQTCAIASSATSDIDVIETYRMHLLRLYDGCSHPADPMQKRTVEWACVEEEKDAVDLEDVRAIVRLLAEEYLWSLSSLQGSLLEVRLKTLSPFVYLSTILADPWNVQYFGEMKQNTVWSSFVSGFDDQRSKMDQQVWEKDAEAFSVLADLSIDPSQTTSELLNFLHEQRNHVYLSLITHLKRD